MALLQTNKEGKTLYAIVWCRRARVAGGWTLQPAEYCHAEDAGKARAVWAVNHPSGKDRIVAIAPAIGFHVHDEHGERLSA